MPRSCHELLSTVKSVYSFSFFCSIMIISFSWNCWVKGSFLYVLFLEILRHMGLKAISSPIFLRKDEMGSGAVQSTSVQTKLVLCTKQPIFTMLFYYIKMQASSIPYHSSLQLTEALKWGTVWTSISTGIETTHGHS